MTRVSSGSCVGRVLVPKEHDLQLGPEGDKRQCAEDENDRGRRSNDRSVKENEEDLERTERVKSGSERGGQGDDARVVGQGGIVVLGPCHSTFTRGTGQPNVRQLCTCVVALGGTRKTYAR